MPPPPGRRGTRGTRATKSTAAEELAPVLGKIAEKKVIASEDYFAPLSPKNKLFGKPDSRHNGRNIHEDSPIFLPLEFFLNDTKPLLLNKWITYPCESGTVL
jgi:hypothetical protein